MKSPCYHRPFAGLGALVELQPFALLDVVQTVGNTPSHSVSQIADVVANVPDEVRESGFDFAHCRHLLSQEDVLDLRRLLLSPKNTLLNIPCYYT